MNLKGKKILFIGPVFYDYHKIIIKKLESLGADVVFYPERNYGLKFSVVNNFFKNKIENFQKNHFLKVLKKTKNVEFDYLFVIKGFKMSADFVDFFRVLHPKAFLIMHQWDSLSNNPFSHLIGKFDSFFSFERKDIEVYKSIQYLPNFYLDDIFCEDVEMQKQNIQYDIFFVASYLPERYNILCELEDFSKRNNLKLKGILFISFKTYFKEYLKGNKMKISHFVFSPLSRKQYLKLWAQSRAIFDISSIKQNGLSQRCIETIEGGKKLITNNHQIIKEIFYSPEQILVLENDDFKSIVQFLDQKVKVNKTNYTLDNWVSTVFTKK